MKKTTTWLASAMIVASAAAGCSVTVTEGDGGTTTGATGGTGGSTGGSGGTGGTGGSGGTAGTGGSSGSGGTAGTTDGGGGTGGGTMCVSNPNTDGRCHTCAFNKCNTEHCVCNAVSTCRTPMLTFYMCISAPNADFVGCATTFAKDANVDGGGGLANDIATCIDTECQNTCAGLDASARNRSQALKAALEALRSGNTQ